MYTTKRRYLYIVMEEKIIFPKTSFIKIIYSYTIPDKVSEKMHVSPDKIWILTDRIATIERARKAHYKTILMANGKENAWEIHALSYPHYIAYSLSEVQNYLHLIGFCR